MKKYAKYLMVLLFAIFIFILISMFNDDYKGIETELSNSYVSKGYAINIYRSFDMETSSIGVVNMKFAIETKFDSIFANNFNAEDNIKKVKVENVRIISKAKLGNIENLAILKRYATTFEDGNVLVKNENTKMDYEYSTPAISGINTIWIELKDIASYDLSSGVIDNPNIENIYKNFDITKENIEFTIAFRVVLETVNGNILFKEYEITVPDIEDELYAANSRYEFYLDNEESFLEKE